MIRSSRFLVMTSAMLATLAGCGDPVRLVADLELPEPVEVTLAIGETHDLEGSDGSISLLGVPSDTRCPTDVTCVWEGNAEVRIQLTSRSRISGPLTLNTAVEPLSVEWADVRVSIVSVSPTPVSSGEIAAGDYRVTLRLERP